jgi:hypothetical protein
VATIETWPRHEATNRRVAVQQRCPPIGRSSRRLSLAARCPRDRVPAGYKQSQLSCASATMFSGRIASMKNVDRTRHPCKASALSRKACAGRGALMRLSSPWLTLLGMVALGATAHAATVTAVQGQVLVSTGAGYRLVDGAAQVGPGGTVVANPGAIARVAYGSNCVVTVQPGSVYSIAVQPPCGAEGPRGKGKSDDTKAAAAGSGSGSGWMIAGAGLAAGGGVAYIIMSLSP